MRCPRASHDCNTASFLPQVVVQRPNFSPLHYLDHAFFVLTLWPPICLLNIPTPSLPSPPLPSSPLHSWRSWWRGGAARALLFLRTVLLVQNTDGYYGAAHKLIMLEINCCCQRQPPTCPTVSLCPLMHRIQLMDQMFAQCAAPFKVSTKVLGGGGTLISISLYF